MYAPDGFARVQREIFLLFSDVALQNAFESQVCRNVFLPNRVRFVENFLEKRFADYVIGELDMLGCRQIAFPEFPCELFDRLLPRDCADDKAARFVDVNRFENVVAARDQKLATTIL